MNLGVYRMQALGKDRAIMRWLEHRGGAEHHRAWAARGEDTPVAVAIGADPATILSAVLPLPETVSELHFSGVLRGERPRIAPALTVPLMVPADAEIVIEGYASASETAPEGPYGDHTGYYNSVETLPRHAHHRDHHAARSGLSHDLHRPAARRALGHRRGAQRPRAADDPAADPRNRRFLAAAGGVLLSPRRRLDQEALSRPGAARDDGRVGLLPQFNYTKMVIVVDDDIDARNWKDVMWALSTRMDPSRDLMQIATRRSTIWTSPRRSPASAASSASTRPTRSAPRPTASGAAARHGR